ncbi:MAG: RNA polymerase sigma factor [Planctomycetota bacterium]|jgi:RNA polymerase sigma-70 factor (ECF subfamily)
MLETELIEATVAGDIDSFGKLAERYYPSMVAIGYSVLSDHGLAEDVAQEAFARALASLRNLRDKARFGPWLARICRNVANDTVTARARQTRTEYVPDTTDDSNDDGIRAVRRALQQLPVSTKELVVLRYYDGLYYEEISSVLGISKASINGRLSRAKRKMAKYLQRDGFLES